MQTVQFDTFDIVQAREGSGVGLASFYNLIFSDRGRRDGLGPEEFPKRPLPGLPPFETTKLHPVSQRGHIRLLYVRVLLEVPRADAVGLGARKSYEAAAGIGGEGEAVFHGNP
ncbi:MAG: hypothetical protein M0Z36_08910 [Thermaerobacter sp.]|nr:hypothetical protein [Thermaerobacter sp.]